MPFLSGFGVYLPVRELTNGELAERLSCTPEWIYDVSGIRTRRVAEASQSVAELGALAAKDCLLKTGLSASDLGMLIVASGSSERRFPGPAVSISTQLNIPGVPSLDLPIASAGSLFGIALANSLTSQYGPILVIAAEKMSPLVLQDPLDKNTAILFGDGAGACLVTPQTGSLKVVDSVIHSDGSFAEELHLDFDGHLTMNGLSVIMQASRKIPAGIREVLDKSSLLPSGVSVFLMHQANQNLIDRVAKALRVDATAFYSNIARYGNTSSASMLIAANEYFDRPTTIAAGGYVCFASFGAGFHWGALLAQKQD